MLADHPNVLTRLRKEVLDTLGPNGKVDRENLREMKYLRAVLNGECSLVFDVNLCSSVLETLRLYPSVYVLIFPSTLTTRLKR